MADEVYKILQSRLRRNAQQRTTDCSDDCRKPNCHQKSSATPSESESQSGHKRRRQTSTAGEVLYYLLSNLNITYVQVF